MAIGRGTSPEATTRPPAPVTGATRSGASWRPLRKRSTGSWNTTVEEAARSRDKKQQGRPSRSPSRNQTSARGRPRSSQPRQTGSQRRAGEAVRQSVAGARPTVRTRPAPSPQRPRKQQGRVFEVSRAVTASALRYALVLHTVAAVGLAVYALTQGGPSNVLPTLDGAADAYVQAWRSVGNVAGLG